MANAHVLIQTQTAGASNATITFSTIPSTYRDLRVVITGSASASSNCFIAYNNDTTGTNYNWVWMMGNGSASSSATGNDRVFGNSQNAQGTMIYDFMDYSVTDKHKTNLARTNFAGIETIAVAERWANTAAINQIAFTANGTTWTTGTTFYLYGVLG